MNMIFISLINQKKIHTENKLNKVMKLIGNLYNLLQTLKYQIYLLSTLI
jgi:hypothetical protein